MAAQPDVRANLHGMWAAVAPGWDRYADFVDARGEEVTAAMLELAALREGARVLELACGPGGGGLAAAELVGPGGEVVLSDVAAEMTAIAAARAEARGLRNVRTLVLDLEEIDQPDASYDAVLCREGFMFAVDPERAASEIARVLRPGGRVALAVWGPRERNPWLGILLDAVSDELGMPMPPPGVPGPFALEDRDLLAGLLSGAGLTEVTVAEAPAPVAVPSFDEWWTRTSALAGPLAKLLEAMQEEQAGRIRERARAALAPFGAELPGVSLVAAGVKGG